MYQVLINPPLSAYDAAVQSLPDASIYQAASWGQLKEEFGWRVARFVVFDEKGRCQAATTVLRRDLPFGKGFLYSPRGPLWRDCGEDAMRFLVSSIQRHDIAREAVLWRIDPEKRDHDRNVHQHLAALGFKPVNRLTLGTGGLMPKRVWHIDLSPNEEELFAQCTPDTRRRCRRAERTGIRVYDGGEQDFCAFYLLLQRTAARKDFALRSEYALRRMWQVWQEHGQCSFLVAAQQDRVRAACLNSVYGGVAMGHFIADDQVSRADSPVHLLYWRLLQWAKQRGARVCDLGGIGLRDDAQALSGLATFKRRFGGHPVQFVGEHDLVLNAVPYLGFRTAEKLLLEGSGPLQRALALLVNRAGHAMGP